MMVDIYLAINELTQHTDNDIYNKLIVRFPKVKVDFVMYDYLSYDGMTIEERERRKDHDFRKNVLARYNGHCIITGVNMPCQVCHIKPFAKSSEKEKYDTNNGMVLRTDIHTLYDNKKIIIDPETRRVIVSPDIMQNAKMTDYHKLNNKIVKINSRSIGYLLS